jgi:hypothetical protein
MRFEAPAREDEILARRENVIQVKTAQDTKYCINVWGQWSNNRDKTKHSKIPPLSTITPAHSILAFTLWLGMYVGSERYSISALESLSTSMDTIHLTSSYHIR